MTSLTFDYSKSLLNKIDPQHNTSLYNHLVKLIHHVLSNPSESNIEQLEQLSIKLRNTTINNNNNVNEFVNNNIIDTINANISHNTKTIINSIVNNKSLQDTIQQYKHNQLYSIKNDTVNITQYTVNFIEQYNILYNAGIYLLVRPCFNKCFLACT